MPLTKLHFIFQKSATRGSLADEAFASSKLVEYLRILDPTVGNQHFQTITDTQFYDREFKPYHIETSRFIDPSEIQIKSDAINICVIPWNRPFLMSDEAKNSILPLHSLQDKHKNLVLLADYSHESMLPGAIGTLFLEEEAPWLEPERYVLMMLGISKSVNIGSPLKFKRIVESANYISATVAEVLSREENLQQRSLHSWVGKQGKFRYIFPNRIGRQHRLDLIVKMHKRNMLKDTEWSLVIPDNDDCIKDSEYFTLFGNAPRRMSRPWHIWSAHDNRSEMQGGPDQRIPGDLLDNGLIMLVADTFVSNYFASGKKCNSPHDISKPFKAIDVSEKVVKPFLYGMPLFYNNRPGSVSALRELGFWLPGGDYNEIEDVDLRMDALLDAAESFEKKISKETVEAVEHNKRLILSKKLHYELSKSLFEAIEQFGG